ncbi:MAG: PDZ domain-containing protein [Candidatus Aminicenantes bacterium]|nr:PDZ domain-containing protein [Candidatus Aminicenantes bacterium]
MKRATEMNKRSRVIIFCLAFLIAASFALGQKPEGTMAFTVSMEQPNRHYYHVVFRGEGMKDKTQDFKMPAWTPGYYQIMDYARNVLNFRAEDGAGNPLAWEKTAKNTWRVKSGKDASITVSYDVYAFNRSVADSYLDDERGFISPTGVFMHVAGRIQHPVTVTVRPCQNWTRVSTGLDPVEGRPNTFFAPDFDILYDCPILIGNQEILKFEVQGIPHVFAGVNLGALDRAKFAADLKRMVESAVALIGEIPYRHYTFLAIGPGGGGLEHLNSTALTFNASGLTSPAGYKRWLSFVSHEYFHHYNVKRIRPIALGPFDYDRENYTNLLWVSEGISVYYEDVILNRAGLLSRDEVFERFQSSIARFENGSGHLFQSATESSFDTWMKFFSRGGNTANTTISYYDKGAALGMLLDFKIRNETKNRKSLDDVMQTLYRKFYKEKKRGFTDQEFREVCESEAGGSLSEIFEYASTVKGIDYPRYFAYAGLDIDVQPRELAGAWFGAAAQDQNGNLMISNVEMDSPALQAGLSVQDEIIALDGTRVTSRTMSEMLNSRKAGDKVRVLISRRNAIREVEVVLGKKMERSFRIKPLANPNPLQAAILKDLFRE